MRSPRAAGLSARAALALDLGALLALFSIVAGPYLARAYESALPSGWDGVPHYAIADLYAREMFPTLFGWMPEYFAGMPYPTFYPPVFYLVVAALTKIGLSTKAAFMGVQTVASAAVPLLGYLCARRLSGSRVGGLVAGALSVGLMVDHNPLWRMGITLHSTFDAGLSTQLLAHCFVLLFYHAFLGHPGQGADRGRAAVFLALVPLTNVHVVWAAAFLFLGVAAARAAAAATPAARARALAGDAAVGAIAILIASIWLLPMLIHIRFVPTLAMGPPPPGVVTFALLRLGAYLVFATIAAVARRDGRAIALAGSLVALLAFAMAPWARLPSLGDLALQPGRMLAAFPFLMTCLVGYLVSVAREVTRWVYATPAVGALCAAIFFLHFRIETEPVGVVSERQAADYRAVVQALDGRKDGRVLVEMGLGRSSNAFALQSLVGSGGGMSLTAVFRESAIDVLFAAPLRNSFSLVREAFGVDHKISAAAFADDPPELHRARLELFNVRYFAAESDDMKARLRAFPGVERRSPEGRWELYAFTDEAPGYAVVPAFSPVLTFAAFSVKTRPDLGLDFVRLGEEMFAASRLDVPLVKSRHDEIDREDGWDLFRTVLVTQYRYGDRARAYAKLEELSRDRSLILVQSDDPLFADLASLAAERGTIHVVPAPDGAAARREAEQAADFDPTTFRRELVAAERRATRKVAGRILDAIDAARVPVPGAARVVRADVERERVTVELSDTPDGPVPVWIRQGYFPAWRRDDGQPIYMATPTFQLTFARSRTTELRFARGPLEWLSVLLGVAGCALSILARARRRAPEP